MAMLCTQIMFEETRGQHSSSASPERTSHPECPGEPFSPVRHGSQLHVANRTAAKQSSEQSQKLGVMTRRQSSVVAPVTLNLVLENKGNVARDHLASERTYLAYVRTSLACASAGVALVQLFTLSSPTNALVQSKGRIDLERFSRPLGATVVIFGLFILILGVVRYFMTQAALVQGVFPVARSSLAVVAFVLGAIVGIVFGLLVVEMRG